MEARGKQEPGGGGNRGVEDEVNPRESLELDNVVTHTTGALFVAKFNYIPQITQ